MAYQALADGDKIIQADDEDLDSLSFGAPQPGPSRIPLPRSPLPTTGSAPSPAAGPSGVSGRIGGDNAGRPKSTETRGFGGIRMETRYTGEPTLDEPISKTIIRDLTSIYAKLVQVVWPARGGGQNQLLRDWDLWGPLVICLSLAIVLSVDAPKEQAMQVFSLVISLIAIGSVVVTINSKLLGGKVSFFQSMCVLGYSLSPILLASVISLLVHNLFVRIPVSLLCWGWSVWASMNFFVGTQLAESRTFLAVYPICLFFFVLAWMIMIQ